MISRRLLLSVQVDLTIGEPPQPRLHAHRRFASRRFASVCRQRDWAWGVEWLHLRCVRAITIVESEVNSRAHERLMSLAQILLQLRLRTTGTAFAGLEDGRATN